MFSIALSVDAQQATDKVVASKAQVAYYIASDAKGIDQVYQQVIDGQGQTNQLTFSNSDVITFSVAYDSLRIAYISDGHLWLQDIGTDKVEVLTAIENDRRLSKPVFSQDNRYIAYSDDGVWLFDLDTKAGKKILEDLSMADYESSGEGPVSYASKKFLVGQQGNVIKLMLYVGYYEGYTTGLYDLATEDVLELDADTFREVLPLSDGRVLHYDSIHILATGIYLAPSLDQLSASVELLDMTTVDDTALTVYQTIEVEPGVIRFFVKPTFSQDQPSNFVISYFEYDVTTNKAGKIVNLSLDELEQWGTRIGQQSPNCCLLPVFKLVSGSDFVTPMSIEQFQIVDLNTGKVTNDTFPAMIKEFQWQPLIPAELQ